MFWIPESPEVPFALLEVGEQAPLDVETGVPCNPPSTASTRSPVVIDDVTGNRVVVYHWVLVATLVLSS